MPHTRRILTTLVGALAALALSLLPASPATASPAPDDPLEALQYPLQLDRGPAPRVISMVGNIVRFPGGRTVRFTPPAEVTGGARLVGAWRRDAIVWAPTGAGRVTIYRIRPGGAVVPVGEPVAATYGDSVERQVAGDVLWVVTSDAQSRTRLLKLSLPTGKVLRQRITPPDRFWILLDADEQRILLGARNKLLVWRGGDVETLYGGNGGAYGDVSFARIEHDWFALRTANGTQLRRISRPDRVVWKDGFENEMIPFDMSGDGSVLLTTQYETYSPEFRDPGTGRVLRRYYGGYRDASNDNEMLVLEGSRAFLVVMNFRMDGKHREVLVRCTVGGDCERASRVASRITLQTYGS